MSKKLEELKEALKKYLLENKDNIEEMSLSYNNIVSKYMDHISCVLEHLIKLSHYRTNEEDKAGWITSIRKGFEISRKQTKGNKLPSANKLYKDLFLSITDILENVYSQLFDDIQKHMTSCILTHKKDYPLFYKLTEEYFQWLTKHLSIKETLSMDEVTEEITYLLNKYYSLH